MNRQFTMIFKLLLNRNVIDIILLTYHISEKYVTHYVEKGVGK